jgi:hypothetical protein
MSTVRELLPVQVHDPAKGTFYPTAEIVKKTRRCSDGKIRPVYKSHKSGHPEDHEFVIMARSEIVRRRDPRFD